MDGSAVFPGDSDKQFTSACAPFSRNCACNMFNRFADLKSSDAIRSLLQILDRGFLTTFQNGLDCPFSGGMTPGEHSQRPSLRALRFEPSSTQILFPMIEGWEVSFTVGGRGGFFGGAFAGGGAGGGPFAFAALIRFDRAEFGSLFFRPSLL